MDRLLLQRTGINRILIKRGALVAKVALYVLSMKPLLKLLRRSIPMLIGTACAFAGPSHLVISQIYGGGGNSGATYKNDFIEIYNPTASPIGVAGWSVQYASATGTSWQVTNLSGTIAPGHYYLVQEAQGSGGTTSLPTPDASGTIAMSATAGKIALANTTTALSGSCPTGASIIDFLGFGTTANCSESSPTANLSNTTAALRKLDASQTPIDTDNNNSDFQIAAPNPHNSASLFITQINPSTVTAGSVPTDLTVTGGGFGADAVVNFTGQTSLPPTPANISPASILVQVPASYTASPGTPSISVTSGGITSNSMTLTITGGSPTCAETETIAQIQGTGRTSAYVSATVQHTSQGIVTYKKSNGFFMQMATGDGDPNTSDAIYVFTSSAPTVNPGDLACVTGNISEYYNGGATDTTDPENTLTEYVSPAVVVISSNNPLPAPVTLSPTPTGSFDQLEKYEGMRVRVPSLTVTGPGGASAVGSNAEANGTYTASGAFWGVVTGTTRPFREPGVESSHPIYVENSTGHSYGLLPANVPVFDSNPERIQIFTGNSGATVIDPAVNAVITNLTGVLDVYYGDFELDEDAAPTPGYVAPTVSNNSPVFTDVPQQLASELTVGTFNLEHFYDDQKNGVNTPFEVVLTTATYQGRLAKASMAIRNVLHMPDILGLEEVENLSTLEALAAKVNNDAAAAGQTNPNYVAYLAEGNDPSGIDVGFLVNSNRVSNVSTTQYFATDAYNGTTLTFDRPPLLLSGIAHNTNRAPLPVTVINNHLKALPADDPTSSSTRDKRQAEAQELAQLIQNLQAATPGILLAVSGDLNAFEFNDSMNDVVGTLEGTPAPANQVVEANTAVVWPNLTELASYSLPASQRYSYTESGNAQQLDHMLLGSGALARLSRFAIGHLNADFPESLKYNYTRPERLSDHDPEVAYLSLPAATDITSSTLVAVSGLAYNRGTQLYSGTITLKNASASAISGPLQVFFNGLPTGVSLVNATGLQGGVLPYITSPISLAPGATAAISVQFRVQGSARVGYTNTIYSGTL